MRKATHGCGPSCLSGCGARPAKGRNVYPAGLANLLISPGPNGPASRQPSRPMCATRSVRIAAKLGNGSSSTVKQSWHQKARPARKGTDRRSILTMGIFPCVCARLCMGVSALDRNSLILRGSRRKAQVAMTIHPRGNPMLDASYWILDPPTQP